VDQVNDQFEWDEEKATVNAEKHGVTFVQATEVFHDPLGIEFYDTSHSENEPRYARVGLSGKHLLMVVFTVRGQRLRIIHARKADKTLETQYVEENS
jgi:uncharacterized protein